VAVVTLIVPKVEVYFDLSASGTGDFLTLDDPVKGKLDDATYVLAGVIAVDITAYCHDIQINRGRSRQLDEINAGVATVAIRNYSGEFTPDGFIDPDTASRLFGFGNITVGRKVEISAEGQTLFVGNIDDWNYSYSNNGTVQASFIAVDALANLAAMDFNAWTTTAGQTAGPRLAAVLDRPEVDYGSNRDLGTGISTLQADAVSYGSNVLTYAQLVAKSDLGRLFANRQGVLVFRDRHSLVNPTARVAFADDGTGAGFHGIRPAFGSELLVNRVGVDREGGTLQTVNNLASQAKYRIRAQSTTGLLMDSDSQSLDMATFIASVFSEPQAYIDGLTVYVDGLSESLRADVLSLDLADVVSVLWTPTGADTSPAAINYVIESVGHSTGFGAVHVVELGLSPIAQAEVLVLDDTILGLLDSGVLAF
jgi:hypothetical protein